MAVTRDQVAKLYVANFNRAPDAAGLDYWISDGTSATTTLTDLNAIAASMQAGAEASTGVASMTNSEYVISLYSSMFGRTVAADSADVAYWTEQITLGNVTRANMIQTLILGAEASTGSATDAAVLANKTTVGLDYADAGLNGTFSVATVTDDAATVTAAQASIDLLVSPAQALTTSTDTFVGTANNDTFTATSATIAAGDVVLDQLTTDNDTMNMTLTAANAAMRVSGVENINVNWNAFGTATVDATNITGAHITGTSTKTGFLGSMSITAAGANTITAGSGMIGTLTVNNATTTVVNGGAAHILVVEADATATTANTATVTAGASTTAVNVGYTVGGVAGDGFATTTVDAGTATVIRIDDSDSAADDGDTAALTFGASATLTNTVDDITVTASAADLTLTIANVETSLTVAGTNDMTLAVAAATTLTTEEIAKTSTGSLTLAITDIDGAADLDEVTANLITVATATVGGNLTVKSAQAVQATATMANNFGLTVAGTATTDTATLTLDATQTAIINFTGIETATIAANATVSASAVDLTIAEINAGTNDVVLTGANDVTITLAEAGELNASALTNNLIVTQDAAAAMDIQGGTANNTVVFKGTTHDNNYTGQNGNDAVTFVNTTGNAVAILGNGTNSVTANALTTGTLVVQGGTGNDTISATALTTGTINLDLGNGTNTVTLDGTFNSVNVTITGGTGVDSVTIDDATVAGDTVTLALAEGTDTLTISEDVTAGTWSVTGLEKIAIGSADTAAKVNSTLLTGQTYEITGDGTATDHIAVEMDAAASVDFSGIAVNQTITKGLAGLAITGSTGNDTIVATAYADTIASNGGNDTMTGGAGQDTVTGGAGVDSIVFASGDAGTTSTTIDFVAAFKTAGADKLKLGTAATATNYAEVDMATVAASDYADALGAANTALNGTVMYAVIENSADTGTGWDGTADSMLFVDFDLDGTADIGIQITGVLGSTGLVYTDIIA